MSEDVITTEPRIRIDPLGVYHTSTIRVALGGTLWNKISTRLPRLCEGIVLGEDVLKVLRDVSARDQQQRLHVAQPVRRPRGNVARIQRINTPPVQPVDISPSRGRG